MTTNTFDRTNTGTLAKNTMKNKDSHPDARGKINVGGIWYWLSGWNKTNASDGSKFVSLATTEMSMEEVERYCTPRQYTPQGTPQQGTPQQRTPQQATAQQATAQQPVAQPAPTQNVDSADDII